MNKNVKVIKEEDNISLDVQRAIKLNFKILKNTDWYYIRRLDTNEEIPPDVVTQRKEAREFLKANGY